MTVSSSKPPTRRATKSRSSRRSRPREGVLAAAHELVTHVLSARLLVGALPHVSKAQRGLVEKLNEVLDAQEALAERLRSLARSMPGAPAEDAADA